MQVGGPLGAYFPRELFDTPFDYEAFAALDGLIGHGGVVVFDDTVDMAHQARFALEFCAIESCGKCTPCRIGSVRGTETMDKIIRGERVEANLALITDLCQTLKFGSLCALGGFTPYPVMSAIRHFPEDFNRPRLAGCGGIEEQAMSLVHEIDYGTPASKSSEHGDAHHRRPGRHGARRHLDHARGDGYRHPGAQALRHRLGRRLRLLPSLPGRDRRAAPARPPRARRRSAPAWSCRPRPSG